MNKTVIIKNLIVGVIVLIICFGDCKKVEAVSSEQKQYGKSNYAMQVYSNRVVWIYKEENGKRYMRLYDSMNEVWLTDWILCA